MKCVSCNSELKEGAKFCTKCGVPVKKNQIDKAEESTTLSSTEESANKPMASVKGMIFWDIQHGEIARRINESEFVQYDSAVGVIINDGTTAYIKSNGAKIAELSGGVYNFIDPKELDKILESRTGGVASGLKSGFKGFVNFILGTKVKDKISDSNEVYKQESVDKIIECMRRDNIMSLTLKLDKNFELLFGESHSNIDDYSSFAPMSIRTKFLDVKMGVRAMFKITDFQLFSKHYLADRSSLSTSYLADQLSPIIRSAVQNVMNDVELDNYTITTDLQNKISNAITTASNNAMYGISLTNVIEISVEDKDIERLRALSRELYLSEKELDYLARTNDFKNRLNVQVDEQEIYDARRVHQRDQTLRSINRDEILDQNEFNKFLELLSFENELRQTRNREEMAILNSEIESRGFDRAHSLYLRQQQAAAEIEQVELGRIRAARLANTQTDVDEQRLRDDYKFDVEDKTDDRRFKNQERENQINNAQADSALERLRKIKEIERLEDEDAHKREMDKQQVSNAHELNLGRGKAEQMEAMSNMSPEQLMAMAANENLSPEAAAEFAKSFSEKHKSANQEEMFDAIKSLNQERINDKDRDADRMERMMREIMQTASNIAGASQQNSENLKNEYRERLERQEDRMDKTQDSALDYTTKNNAIGAKQAAPQSADIPVYYHVDIEGKEDAKLSLPQLSLLIHKGVVNADTFVFSSATNDWSAASQIKEIAHLFI